MKGFIADFKAFALRGNIMDLAVGVVIGGAFGAIVTSLVADIIMPIVGIVTGGIDFSGLAYTVGASTIAYGKFLQAAFVFAIVAWALFLVVKAMNTLKKKEEAKPAVPTEEVVLLREIRDSLKNHS
jgi:large conductance mechanosensitive channel